MPRPRSAARVRDLAAILIAAFNLRIGIVAVAPLIEQIRADTGMSSALGGALTTIPVVCMGIFSLTGPALMGRFGTRRVTAFSLILIAAGSLVRAVAPSPVLILVTTLPIGIGIGLMGVTLPVVVKERFPAKAGAVTGAYVASLSIGIAIVAVTMVPIADALGDWRDSFAVTALPALLALPMWILGPDRQPGHLPSGGASRQRAIERRYWPPDRTVGWTAAAFGLQSMCFYGMVGWIAAVYVDNGWTESDAALTTSSIGLLTIVAALSVPQFSEGGDRRRWIAWSGVVMAVGATGVAFAPTAVTWLWLLTFGFGSGATFALLLVLPLDLEPNPRGVARLSSQMQGLGYCLAAFAPVLIGALRDFTGGFMVPVTLVAVFSLLSAAAVMAVPNPARQSGGDVAGPGDPASARLADHPLAIDDERLSP